LISANVRLADTSIPINSTNGTTNGPASSLIKNIACLVQGRLDRDWGGGIIRPSRNTPVTHSARGHQALSAIL
jgi:hypothetical protein